MASTSSHTMRCINCQENLPANSGPQCEKCRKNEQKYGKPTNCIYCKLPAAFTEEKCVYCCYFERKHGAPVQCANCKMKSVFTRHPKKPALCRLCVMIAKQQGMQVMNGIPVPREKESHKDHSDGLRHHRMPVSQNPKKRHQETVKKENSPTKQPKLDTTVLAVNSQNVQQIQQLQDKVDELQRVVSAKDKLLLRKDAEIAQLKTDILTTERKYRDTVQLMTKEKDEALEKTHLKYQEQWRQHRAEKQEKERQELQEKAKKEREKKAKKEKEKQEALERKKKEKEREEALQKEKDLAESAKAAKEAADAEVKEVDEQQQKEQDPVSPITSKDNNDEAPETPNRSDIPTENDESIAEGGEKRERSHDEADESD